MNRCCLSVGLLEWLCVFEIPWLDLYLLQVLLMHAFITRLLALDTTSCTLWEVAGIATLGFIPIRTLAPSLLLAY